MRAFWLLLLSGMLISAPEAATSQPPPLAFGTNVGHWLSQATLDRAEMATFFTEADVARIKGWGMDHIRVPVDSPLIAGETDREHFAEEGLSWIDRAVTWTRAAGLTLVLDMHHLPGHGFMAEATNTIWTDGPDRRQALALWRTLAARYKGQPHVVFELLNEPVAPAGRDELWHALARDLLAAVRSVNQENWIMIGSNRWSNVSTFATLPAFDDPRIIYTFHLYDPFLFTHQRASWVSDEIRNLPASVPYPGPLPREVLYTPGLVREYGWMADRPYGDAFLRERLAPVLTFRETHRVPVYCGEFGVLDTAPTPDREQWYRNVTGIFRRESIGFANWNYKSDNFGLVDRTGTADRSLLQAIGASRDSQRAGEEPQAAAGPGSPLPAASDAQRVTESTLDAREVQSSPRRAETSNASPSYRAVTSIGRQHTVQSSTQVWSRPPVSSIASATGSPQYGQSISTSTTSRPSWLLPSAFGVPPPSCPAAQPRPRPMIVCA